MPTIGRGSARPFVLCKNQCLLHTPTVGSPCRVELSHVRVARTTVFCWLLLSHTRYYSVLCVSHDCTYCMAWRFCWVGDTWLRNSYQSQLGLMCQIPVSRSSPHKVASIRTSHGRDLWNTGLKISSKSGLNVSASDFFSGENLQCCSGDKFGWSMLFIVKQKSFDQSRFMS